MVQIVAIICLTIIVLAVLNSRSLNSFYLFVNQRFDVEKRRFT